MRNYVRTYIHISHFVQLGLPSLKETFQRSNNIAIDGQVCFKRWHFADPV